MGNLTGLQLENDESTGKTVVKFVKHRIDLTLHLPCRPTIVGCLQLIIFPFVFIGYAYKQLILTPVELRPQCGRNWKSLVVSS